MQDIFNRFWLLPKFVSATDLLGRGVTVKCSFYYNCFIPGLASLVFVFFNLPLILFSITFVYLSIIYLFIGNTGVGTQGIALAIQAIYHLCHVLSSFLLQLNFR
jgi:hypothetical protein